MHFTLLPLLFLIFRLLIVVHCRSAPWPFTGKLASVTARDVTVRASTGSCPLIWQTIGKDLQTSFSGCNQVARYAIRFAFHDAGAFSTVTPFYEPAAGGADGSLLLNAEELARSANDPLSGYGNFLLGKYSLYGASNVSAADLVQFAGSLAIASCPGGPIVKTVRVRFVADRPHAAPL